MKEYEDSACERLMHSAAKLFAQKGFDGTTTRQIVADAGSSLSSLQAHFQSKESLYRAVIERTLNTFCELNAPIINEIRSAETDGSLDADTAWGLIVELTTQILDWAFSAAYRNEISIINREILMSEENGQELPRAAFLLYELFENLFEFCAGMKNQDWIKMMSFSLVTSAFDYANYPRVINYVLGCGANQPENLTMLKTGAKDYLLTCARANLDAHKSC